MTQLTGIKAKRYEFAVELLQNGEKYRPHPDLGKCQSCGNILTPDDILTISNTYITSDAANCDSCH